MSAFFHFHVPRDILQGINRVSCLHVIFLPFFMQKQSGFGCYILAKTFLLLLFVVVCAGK